MHTFEITAIIFIIATVMTMTGRGGGSYYVFVLAIFSTPMHEAATTGQLILFTSAIFASFIFGKKRIVEWKLFFFIGLQTTIFAFLGGYFSGYFSGQVLKYIFSFFMLLASISMLKSFKKLDNKKLDGWNYWRIETKKQEYVVNLTMAIPVICLTAFFAGMVGVSGGSFLVPLMVLAFGVPMRIAVVTSITLVAATAFSGFLGHVFSGGFDYKLALPLIAGAAIGGMLGGKIALTTNPTKLKQVFALTALGASIIMFINACTT
jgi:uncharacterized membrane protein YfcA